MVRGLGLTQPSGGRRAAVGQRWGVLLLTVALTVVAAVTGLASQQLQSRPDPAADLIQWALMAVALVVAGYLTVEIRHHGEVEALDVFEVALAPAIYLMAGREVVLLVAVTKAASQLLLRMPPSKLLFNTAQWAACAGAGSLCFALLATRGQTVLGLVAAMFVVLVANLAALVGLLALVTGRAAVAEMLSVHSLQWSVSLTVVTTAAGLGVATAATDRPDALLFVVALPVLLYWAGRGYTLSQAELARSRSLQAGTRALSAVHDVRADPGPFLAEVTGSCQAVGAELALRREVGKGFEVYRHGIGEKGDPGRPARTALTRALLATPRPVHVVAKPRMAERSPLSEAVRQAGWRDCLAVPITIDGQDAGELAVFDRSGVAGLIDTDLATMEAFGRELAAAVQRAKLVDQLVDARRDAARIIESSGDGIMAVAVDGWVVTWNPGFSALTGHSEEAMLQPGGLAELDARDDRGQVVPLVTWSERDLSRLPRTFSVRATDGRRRWLSCSYAGAKSDDGVGDLLVVTARDVTEFRRRQELIAAQGVVLELIATREPPERILEAVTELVGAQLECVVAFLPVGDAVSRLPEIRWDGGRPGLDWAWEGSRMADVAARAAVVGGDELVSGPGPYRALAVRDGHTGEVRAAIVVRVPTLDQPDDHGRQVMRTAARLVALTLDREPADGPDL